MTKTLALSRIAIEAVNIRQADALRGAVVLASALALILAGQPLPF